jgi:hypothetical protein
VIRINIGSTVQITSTKLMIVRLEISGFRIINKEIPVIKVKILAMIDNEKS